jgi:transcriptional regulator with XRE-family HTH domain
MTTETLKRTGRPLKDISPRNSLRAIRLHLALTLVEASKLTGIEFQSLSAYETGRYLPGLARLLKLSEAYKFPLEKLLDANFDPAIFFSK